MVEILHDLVWTSYTASIGILVVWYIEICRNIYIYVCMWQRLKNIGLVTGPGGLFATRLATESGGLAANPPCDKPIEGYSTLHRAQRPATRVCNKGPATKVCNRAGGGRDKPLFRDTAISVCKGHAGFLSSTVRGFFNKQRVLQMARTRCEDGVQKLLMNQATLEATEHPTRRACIYINEQIHKHTHTHIYIYTYRYIYVYIYLCIHRTCKYTCDRFIHIYI